MWRETFYVAWLVTWSLTIAVLYWAFCAAATRQGSAVLAGSAVGWCLAGVAW